MSEYPEIHKCTYGCQEAFLTLHSNPGLKTYKFKAENIEKVEE